MRKAFLLAFALVACAKNDAPSTDSAAGTVAAGETHSPLTASDVAGTWTGMTMAEGSDSVLNRWTTMRESDTAGKLYNYFGLEPYEEAKKGLSVSLFIPGDGMREIFYIDHTTSGTAYVGSSAVSAKIIESRKEYD